MYFKIFINLIVFLHVYSLNLMPKNPNRWYVIGEINQFSTNKANKIILNNIPISVWKDNKNDFSAIYDVCPHRGASLSKGRIDENNIVCPYHTFKFNCKGRMIQTPGSNVKRTNDNFKLKTDVPYFEITTKGKWVYLKNTPLYEIDLNSTKRKNLWIEPEAYDSSYRCVYLNKKFNCDARTVTENSLDILHISEIHSFGNPNNPLPITDKIVKIDEGHFKIIYEYEAGDQSIPKKIFGENKLIVENEFIIPHYTVARVKFGNFINTIVTSALPINDKETQLFVKAYRNNWVFPKFNFLNDPFDFVTEKLMEKTLNEDKNVIDSIYYDYREGNFITKFDELTKLYREHFD